MATEQQPPRFQHRTRLQEQRAHREGARYVFAPAEFGAVLDTGLVGATAAEVGQLGERRHLSRT